MHLDILFLVLFFSFLVLDAQYGAIGFALICIFLFKYFFHLYELCPLRLEHLWTWIFLYLHCSSSTSYQMLNMSVQVCVLNASYDFFVLRTSLFLKIFVRISFILLYSLSMQISFLNFILFPLDTEYGNLGS